jgi:hypothetical protein
MNKSGSTATGMAGYAASGDRGRAMAIMMSKDVITRQLKSVPLFSDLAPEELDALASVARSVAFRRKTRMFEEGSPADCCFVLTSGRARDHD